MLRTIYPGIKYMTIDLKFNVDNIESLFIILILLFLFLPTAD